LKDFTKININVILLKKFSIKYIPSPDLPLIKPNSHETAIFSSLNTSIQMYNTRIKTLLNIKTANKNINKYIEIDIKLDKYLNIKFLCFVCGVIIYEIMN
jgi:hypothetical protein